MGAYRDEQLFRQMDARAAGHDDGYHQGIATAAMRLGITPELVEDLATRDLLIRTARLQEVADAVGALLLEAEDRSNILRRGTAAQVALDLVAYQLPVEAPDDSCYINHPGYRLELNEGVATVASGATGGGMYGSWHFESLCLLSPDWVSEHMQSLGIERSMDFCGQVAEEICLSLSQESEQNG